MRIISKKEAKSWVEFSKKEDIRKLKKIDYKFIQRCIRIAKQAI